MFCLLVRTLSAAFVELKSRGVWVGTSITAMTPTKSGVSCVVNAISGVAIIITILLYSGGRLSISKNFPPVNRICEPPRNFGREHLVAFMDQAVGRWHGVRGIGHATFPPELACHALADPYEPALDAMTTIFRMNSHARQIAISDVALAGE